MKKFLLGFFTGIFSFIFSFSFAQTISPQQNRFPTQQELDIKFSSKNFNQGNPVFPFGQPEQDCSGSIAVCQQSYSQPNSYVGYGNVQEVYNTCLSTQEKNSVWYVFTVQNSGTFGFLIQTSKDYDFALYDITTSGCSGIPSATPVRCNYSATYGNTGIDENNPQAGNLSYTASDQPVMPGMNVTAGSTYALIVDNYTGDNTGYTLNFGGTAQIFDVNPPTVASASACVGNTITVNFSEPLQCTSITPNGSNFTLSGPNGNVPLLSATGVGCGTLTSQVNITFSNIPAQPSGTFTLTLADANITDKCGNPIVAGGSVNFDYLAPISITTPNATICAGDTAILTASGGPSSGATFSWSPVPDNDSALSVSPVSTTTYVVSVTYGGCTRTASQTINIGLPPTVSVSPVNITICSGTIPLTATANLNGVPCTNCNFNWTGTVTQTDNNVSVSTISNAGQGSYTVTVSSSTGCVGNSVTATVSGPSSPPIPSCNILYVSPTGGGTGLTKLSPIDLQTALNMAQCNNVVIKMTTGSYTINNPITTITSFVTLEGGYDATFSAKSSLAGATKIFRTTANLQGTPSAPRLVALEIIGQSNFRLQDLTIEVDNAPASTGFGVSTYALHITNCSNYNIVRCQLIAGAASAGASGTSGTNGANGGVGSNGGNGSENGNNCSDGTGGSGGSSPCGNPGGNGGNGGCAGGNSGGSGQTGGGAENNSVNSGGGTGGTAGCEPSCDMGCSVSGCANGGTGQIGSNGSSGTAGISGNMGTFSNFFTPGSAGGIGTNGTCGKGGGGGGGGGSETDGGSCVVDDGVGAGGGAGGGGGGSGIGGLGGYGGGSAFGVFLFGNGGNTYFTDCSISTGVAGAGGTGGGGGSGGTGGNGGIGGSMSCDNGDGGNGGKGGDGGSGGSGGSGLPGVSIAIYRDGSSVAPFDSDSVFNLASQFTITVDNISCTGTNINYTSSGSPNWTNFGSGSSPPLGSGSPFGTQYSTTGRKTVSVGGQVYTDFTDILVGPPTSGTILSGSNSICAGLANFTYSLAGTPGLNYTWSVVPNTAVIDSQFASSTNITFTNTDTTAITYTVTLDISSECCGNLPSLTYSIDVNPYPSATTVISPDTFCDGGTDTLFATGPLGSSFYWYDAQTGGNLLFAGNNYVLGPVTAGDTFYVENINPLGCASQTRTPVELMINQISAPATVDAYQCDTGIVFVSVNPFTGATGYNWYDEPTGGTLLQSGTSFSYGINLTIPGTSDTVYVSVDFPGCAEGLRAMAIASVDDSLFSFNPDEDTICNGGSDTLDIGVNGAYGNYSYLWSPVLSPDDTLANPVVSGITASTSYSVQIISGACTTFAVLPLIVAAPIQLDSVVANANCNAGSDGTANVSALGGTSPYSFIWSNGDTTATADSLPAGTYYVTMTDALGCLANDSLVVSQPAVLSETHSSTNTSCPGASDGTATVTPSGGTIPYSYLWSNGCTSPNCTDLPTGVYNVTVTDANGCSASTSVLVNALPAITLLPGSTTNKCYNDSSGSATVMAIGGTAPYSYAWNDWQLQTAKDAINLPAGTYTVTVTDVNGCTNATSITLNPVPEIFFASLSDSTSCFGSNNGTATIFVASGGNSPYNYVWSDGQTTQTATGLDSGFYSVSVTDFLGCEKDTILQVGVLPPMVLGATGDSTSCFGANDGTAFATVASGGNSPYDFVWSTGQISIDVISSVATGLDSGFYSVIVTDALGCKDSTTVTVYIELPMVLNTIADSCHGWYQDATASVSVASGGNPPYTYLWNTNPVQSKDTAVGLDTGTYKVVIIDSLGCRDSTYVTVGSNAVKANFGAEPITGTPPLEVVFTDSSLGNIYTYSWNFGNNNFSSSQSPNASFSDSGTFVVLLTVKHNNDICEDTFSLKIIVEQWEIPNIFTPNGDGKNDVFTIKNLSIKTAEAVIYNRWGQRIYSWTDMANGFWDGRTEGGELAPAGVYYYVISATGVDGKEHSPLKGTVTLAR